MVEGFTQMIDSLEKKYVLDGTHRCDVCGAQAYVQTIGTAGDLLFCAHHYEGILSNEKAQKAMTQFAYQIIDERDKLNIKESTYV